MLNLKKIIDVIAGKTHINNSWLTDDSPLMLHISDTPSQFYSELKRIIDIIKPQYIVHTGDLADDIKIELSPSLLTKYKHESKKLLKILDSSNAEDIYISLGNHDDYSFVNDNKGRIKIYTETGELNINRNKFIFSHYYNYLKDLDADVYLFGHNIEYNNSITDLGIYLNGIISINIINLDTLEVKCIKYPFGTDSARMKQNRIRI